MLLVYLCMPLYSKIVGEHPQGENPSHISFFHKYPWTGIYVYRYILYIYMICGNGIFQICSPHSPLFVTVPPFFWVICRLSGASGLPNILTYRNPEAVRTWDLQGIYMGFIWTFYMAFIWIQRFFWLNLYSKYVDVSGLNSNWTLPVSTEFIPF